MGIARLLLQRSRVSIERASGGGRIVHATGASGARLQHLLQAADKLRNLLVFRFLTRAIDNQPGRHAHDLSHLDETILGQCPSALNQIDDPFAQPNQRGELDR